MKKGSLIALVVAMILILAGGVIVVLGISHVDEADYQTRLFQQDLSVAQPFQNIWIETDDCDVTFIPVEEGSSCYVTLYQWESVSHSVTVEENALRIAMEDHRNWKDFIGIHWEQMQIHVYLPKGQYQYLQVATATGDIQLPAAWTFQRAQLRSNTGDIELEAAVTEELHISTDTGNIDVQGCAPTLLKADSDTGDIECKQIDAVGEVQIETSTGEVELENVLVEGALQIITDTGDVSLEEADAGTVNIQTNTGDVSGHFLTSKWFQAHSDTGNVRVPHTREGGECRIESNTGDIHFE